MATTATPPSWLHDVYNFGNLSNLPPDMWSQIQNYNPNSGGGGQYQGWDYGGYHINPEVSQMGGENNAGTGNTLNGFTVTQNGEDLSPGAWYGHYDPTGKFVGANQSQDLHSGQLFLEGLVTALSMGTLGPAMAAGDATAAAGGASMGATELGTNGAFLGEGAMSGIPAWDGAAGSGVLGGAGGVGSTFGVVDNTVGAGSGLSSIGNAGQGLTATAGNGLNLASTTGAPGLTATAGTGTALTNGATGLGLNSTVAGNALLDGAGLTGGLANGSGSLLGPTAAAGSYTLADGTVISGAGPGSYNGSAPVPGGGTGSSTTTTTGNGTGNPPIPGTGTGTGTSNNNNNNSGFDWSRLLGLIPGLNDQNNQSRSSDQLLAWLQSQQAKIDDLYAPGSPEYNYLWEQMSRTDAAAGRNSQYGPRSVDLAARIAQIKADDTTKLTSGIAPYMAFGINQGNNSNSGLIAAIAALAGAGNGTSGGSYINQLINSLTGSNSNSATTNLPGSANYNDPTGLPSGSDLGGDPFAY